MEYAPSPWRQLARSALDLVLPKRLFVTRGLRRSNSVFLTFDDGPHPEHTPRVLDALAEIDAKATFFVIGREAEKHPDLVKRIASEGHSIGDHTWTHSDVRTLSASAFRDELKRSTELLAELTGKPVRLFRPPFGKIGAGHLLTLIRGGHTVVLWNTDPRDYSCQTAEEVQSNLSAWRMQAGDIVLLHDSVRHAAESASWIAGRKQSQNAGLSLRAL
jgi:peptidoglycan/xylan/chitin deacetylase (PgdA/CDA1 family)